MHMQHLWTYDLTALYKAIIIIIAINCVVQRRGGANAASADGSAVNQFLCELCDSSVVKRPVTLLAHRYRTVIGRLGRKYHNINDLHLTGSSETLTSRRVLPFSRFASFSGTKGPYPYLTLPCLTFGVGRLLHLPSAEAVSVRPNAQPRCNQRSQ